MVLGFGKKEPEWKGKRKGKLMTIQLSDELYAKLISISQKYGVSKSQLIRDALIEKLNSMEED